jgi:hypothetical protein
VEGGEEPTGRTADEEPAVPNDKNLVDDASSDRRRTQQHQGDPSPHPPAADPSTSVRPPPAFVVEGRHRNVEKFHHPPPATGSKWRLTKGEVLAVVLGSVAAGIVIIGKAILGKFLIWRPTDKY